MDKEQRLSSEGEFALNAALERLPPLRKRLVTMQIPKTKGRHDGRSDL